MIRRIRGFRLKVVIVLLLCVGFHKKVLSARNTPVQEDCQKLNEFCLMEALHLTKKCVGFSAPVAARSLMYVNLGLYEVSLLVLPENQSLSKQLTGFERHTWPKSNQNIVPKLATLSLAYELLSYFYKNMPPSEKKALELKFENQEKTHSKGVKQELFVASKQFGISLAQEIIAWSKLDGGDQAYLSNFPETYEITICDSCWTRTYPGYKFALQPYWGQNAIMIEENGNISDDIPFIGFSTDTNSIIYKDAKGMYDLYTDGSYTKEMETIADYWNDEPGYSGTPSGHFFALALELSKDRNLNLKASSELFASLGIAINDAVIESFRLKYKYNLLRPITYISKYIGKGFNTVIPSPPFPEFPSGHSYQSGAGSEVLKAFLGDDFSFIDYTNQDRIDIKGKPRSFENITAMSEEISISRLYGGIHFLYTLDTSLVYGRKIGLNTLKHLKFDQ